MTDEVFQIVITSPIEVSLRPPEPGGVEVMEVRFQTGPVTAELDQKGLCRLVLPRNALRLRLNLNAWRAFEAALRGGKPDHRSLARALKNSGASEPAVNYLCGLLPKRSKRGKPPELDPLQTWLRGWIMNVEVVYLQLKGKSRKEACQAVAEWHGLKPNYVYQKVPATGEYSKFARISNVLPPPRRV